MIACIPKEYGIKKKKAMEILYLIKQYCVIYLKKNDTLWKLRRCLSENDVIDNDDYHLAGRRSVGQEKIR